MYIGPYFVRFKRIIIDLIEATKCLQGLTDWIKEDVFIS